MARVVTNHDLETLLDDAGYLNGHAAFARQINLAIPGTGRYDAASVYWWLCGRRPESPVRTVIAAVLSRRLHRIVAVDELGFDGDTGIGLTYPAGLDDAITT